MHKIALCKPTLIMLYGYPGAGKTHFASRLSESLVVAHLRNDSIRHELFRAPKYSEQEDEIVENLMLYMAKQFLLAGVSVIYDTNACRLTQRRTLRDIARKAHGGNLLIWLQIDAETAKARLNKPKPHKNDSKSSASFNETRFEKYAGKMQNPTNEDYTVISGKHTYSTQKSAVMKRLYDLGAITSNSATAVNVIKPGLVNLVPNASSGRVDMSRRNIAIK